MKILIYTAMWERHQIANIFSIGIKRFINDAPNGIECEVLAVCSTKEAVELCKKHEFHYIEADNKPLGKKWNKGLNYAINNLKFDYVLIMGDDDLISSEAWNYYEPYLNANIDYFGFNSIYFYDTIGKSCLEFQYKEKYEHKLIGCGRMISRKAIVKAGYYTRVNMQVSHALMKKNTTIDIPTFQAIYLIGMNKSKLVQDIGFHLWNNVQNTGLDNESEMNLLMIGVTPISIKTDKPLMVDLKTEFNIWKFDTYNKLSVQSDFKEVNFLSKKELKLINEIK